MPSSGDYIQAFQPEEIADGLCELWAFKRPTLKQNLRQLFRSSPSHSKIARGEMSEISSSLYVLF